MSEPASALPTAIVPPIDLGARVVYFPVRHHSPACAWHVRELMRAIKPDAVLIEGPRDATGLVPLLLHKKTRLPVAIYTTYVERTDLGPRRHAAYYPFCDYSPELVAIREAENVGASIRFVDLTFPEMVRAGRQVQGSKATSLLEERRLTHGRFIQEACRRARARDPDDLWDQLFEVDHRAVGLESFVRNVMTYCALARASYEESELESDGTIARERAMAAAIAEERGRLLVVTGGFHSVALPGTKPAMPEPMKVADADAVVTLTRYGFEQLDRLNGYASGMPAPAYYQRLWDEEDPVRVFVDLGRMCREKRLEISVADEIAAADQCRRLAQLRNHPTPSREDVLDGVRSSFVKGAADSEGVIVLAMARQLLAGDRVGDVPPDAGQPPIVSDFRNTATRLKIDLDKVRGTDTALDLYRRPTHREISRMFHQLTFMGVPFAKLQRGPDFVAGKDLERVQELWTYHWSPEVESALIERSLYGPTLDEAAAGMLVERFAENEAHGQGRRADLAAALVLDACRMGLHRHTPDLMRRTRQLVADDQSFESLVRAMESLLVLQVSREPLEAHRLEGVSDLAGFAYERACYLIPELAAVREQEESAAIEAMLGLSQSLQTLGDTPERSELRGRALLRLAASTDGNHAIRGASVGLLHADGRIDDDRLAQMFRGHLVGAGDDSDAAASFLRGLLRTARNVLWQVEQITRDLHRTLAQMQEQRFVRQLPLLRLAFAGLTPRETDQVADLVAQHAGVGKLQIARSDTFSSADMLLAVEVQRRLAESLARDGLGEWGAR